MEVLPETFNFRQITNNSSGLFNSLASETPILCICPSYYKLIHMHSCLVLFQTIIQVGE